jgi:lambda repressor-like predicted transcriptional regulator
MGRTFGYRKPASDYKKEYQKELKLLANGVSLRDVSKLTGHSINTLRKIKQYI